MERTVIIPALNPDEGLAGNCGKKLGVGKSDYSCR